MPKLDTASQLGSAAEGNGYGNPRVRGPEDRTLRLTGNVSWPGPDTTGKRTAYPAYLANRNHRKRRPPLHRIAPKKAPRLINMKHVTRKEIGKDVEVENESADKNNERNSDLASKAAQKALV